MSDKIGPHHLERKAILYVRQVPARSANGTLSWKRPRYPSIQSVLTNPDIVNVVRALARVSVDRAIAGYLNRNGLKTGRGNRWTQERVTSLRGYHKIPNHCPKTKQREGWMNLTEAAAFLGLSSRLVRLAAKRGEIPGEHPLSDGPWIFRRKDLESKAAKQLVQRTRQRRKNPAVPAAGQQSLGCSGT